MGDFDRNAKPAQGSETKKVLMVVALGAVLLGVVGFQMMKRGPAQAAASIPNNDAAPAGEGPAIAESPDVLREGLMRDPTSSLLLSAQGAQINTAALRNPFRMSEPWRKSITKVEPLPVFVPTPSPVRITPEPVVPVSVVPSIPTLRAADYKLALIMSSNGQLTALINGATVSTGSLVKDAVVVEVRNDAVTLRHKDVPDGSTLELKLKSN